MKKAKGTYALVFREHLEHMMIAHFVFLIAEFTFYNFMLFTVLTEVFYLWLCYYCYMTLKNYACYAYIIVMGLSPLYSFWTLFSIGLIKMLFYMIQLYTYCYFGGYQSFLKYKKYSQEL